MTEHTDEQLLAMAMANLGEYMHDNSPHYVLIEEDPRNEDDFDTWEVMVQNHCLMITLGNTPQSMLIHLK
jgi:hypothetical protein